MSNATGHESKESAIRFLTSQVSKKGCEYLKQSLRVHVKLFKNSKFWKVVDDKPAGSDKNLESATVEKPPSPCKVYLSYHKWRRRPKRNTCGKSNKDISKNEAAPNSYEGRFYATIEYTGIKDGQVMASCAPILLNRATPELLRDEDNDVALAKLLENAKSSDFYY